MKRLGTALVLIFLLCISGNLLTAQSLWRDKSLYSAGSSLKAGDTIIVRINDLSQLNFSVTNSDASNFSIATTPDKAVTAFLPPIASNKKIGGDNSTKISGGSKLQLVIASRVSNRIDEKTVSIAGEKEYSLNGRVNRFRVSGVVDTSLLKGREITSDKIANFRMEFVSSAANGNVTVQPRQLKPDESAKLELNEAEKQAIINDYLQKIINELGR